MSSEPILQYESLHEGKIIFSHDDELNNINNAPVQDKFILGIDIGTTNIRSYVYNSRANVVGKAQRKIEILYPDDKRIEINPNTLWQNFQDVIKESLIAANLSANCVEGLGISTQRGTFLTWDRQTGVPFHNFISWKDKRADDLCNQWNASLKMKVVRYGSLFMYMLTRNKRYKAGSMLNLSSALVLMRLRWVLENIPQVRHKCVQNEVLFGTIETWLLWKLTGGEVHATDYSNASVTGLFDPFQLDWAKWALTMFEIPINILPNLKCTSDSFGKTLPEIFGSSISINAVVGDQQASMFGQCSFEIGDVNLTLGTGSFLVLNTGSSPCTSEKEVFPSVGWTINGKTTYLLECGTSDTGTIISWGQSLGFYEMPEESSQVASSVKDSGGVLFLPTYNKLEGVIPNFSGTSTFVGIRPQTTKAQLVRSMLEAICFQVHSLYKAAIGGSNSFVKKLSVCGGVSNNDFVVQLITNLASVPVTRSKHFDTSSLGAALLAGLSTGMFKNQKEIHNFPKEEEQFSPCAKDIKVYSDLMDNWEKAMSCCSKFL